MWGLYITTVQRGETPRLSSISDWEKQKFYDKCVETNKQAVEITKSILHDEIISIRKYYLSMQSEKTLRTVLSQKPLFFSRYLRGHFHSNL